MSSVSGLNLKHESETDSLAVTGLTPGRACQARAPVRHWLAACRPEHGGADEMQAAWAH